MKKNFKEYLELQIQKNNIKWESKSELIVASGIKPNGNIFRILKKFEHKFEFGSIIDLKNEEIYKYFQSLPNNSFISVEGAVKIINKKLPKEIKISETIIYNRLKDSNFNNKNLKGQTLHNQVSKTAAYDVNITDKLKDRIKKIRKPGIYLYIEFTQRGGQTLRLKTDNKFGNLDKSFPPSEESIETIVKLLKSKNNNSDA